MYLAFCWKKDTHCESIRFKLYKYIVSWRDPLLTGFAFAIFLAFAIKFNSEYVGCLPFLFLVVCMFGSAFSRSNAKKRFVQEEAEEWKAVRLNTIFD